MFIYLENLIRVEDSKEEIYLIPEPRYLRRINSQKLKINENTKLFTDLEDDFYYLIESIQDSLQFFNLKREQPLSSFKLNQTACYHGSQNIQQNLSRCDATSSL